jgi:hypothetical protein
VFNQRSETFIAGVTFIRDASLPSGGVLVATQQAAREIADLPPGTVILGGAPVDGVGTPEPTSASTHGGTPIANPGHLTLGPSQYFSGLFSNPNPNPTVATPVAASFGAPQQPPSAAGWEVSFEDLTVNLRC